MGKAANGEGSLKFDGRYWVARLTVELPNGTVKRLKRSAKLQKDAAKKLRDLRAQRDAGKLPLDGRITVAQLLPEFLEECRRRGRTERTIEGYDSIIRHHLTPGLGKRRLSELRGRHIRAFLGQLAKPKPPKPDGTPATGQAKDGLSPRTIGHILACLRTALEFAVQQEYIATNVAATVEPPTVDVDERPVLTPEQVDTFLDAIGGHRFERIYLTGVFTGARLSEVLALHWSAVSFAAQAISIEEGVSLRRRQVTFGKPKRRKTRVVAMPDELLEALAAERQAQVEAQRTLGGDWCNPLDLVFVRPDGRPIDGSVVTKELHAITDRLGLPRVNFHDLRHTNASILIDEGAPIGQVADHLGHSKASTTMTIYRHAIQKSDRALADLMSGAVRRAKRAGISDEKSS